jgi:hypothetical protein
VVALFDVLDFGAFGGDDARGFVAEDLGDATAGAVHLVELGVADAGSELLNDDLIGAGIGEGDFADLQGTGIAGDDDDAGWGGHERHSEEKVARF